MSWLSRIVTFLLVCAIVGAGVMLVRAAMPNQNVGQEFRTYALMRDGSRLAVGSPVVIAGVRVGEIEKLSIVGDFARADLVLRDATNVPRDSWITKRAESAFGDSYLEIIPPEDEGAAGFAPLEPGQPLQRVIEGGSTDTVLRTIDHAMPRMNQALDGVHGFLDNGRHWVATAMRDGADRTQAWLADGKIEAGMSSADRAAVRLDEGTARAADAVANARPGFDRTLDRADAAIANARTKMSDVRTGLHDGLEKVRTGLDSVDQPIQDYQDVVTAINSSKGNDYRGKLGRLINDHELGDQIADGAEGLRDASSSLDRFKSYLGIRIEYNVFAKVPRIYATAELRARNDKFYLIELERDSLGGLPADDLSDAAGTTTYTRSVTISDQLRFTAQFGKQLGWLALRGGIKDSTFGIGADGLFHGGRLKLSADAFGGFSEQPRLKLTAALAVFRSLYIVGGVDDVFTKPGYLAIDKDSQFIPDEFHSLRYGRDYFLGAMLHFDDDDLAVLLRVYGGLLVKAL